MTLIIEIEDQKQKSLESIAARKGKRIGEVIKEILDDYLFRQSLEDEETRGLMKLSESSFDEWNNEEDTVYDKL